MEKDTVISSYNHSVNLVERKTLLITGVKKIESFDEEEFFMETNLGFLTIKGEGLELIKLDTLQGNVSIKGLINSFAYQEDAKGGTRKERENGIFNRLFK